MINPKDLKEVPLVYMNSEKQDEIMKKYIDEEKKLKEQMKELQVKIDNLKFDLYDKMNIKDGFEIM